MEKYLRLLSPKSVNFEAMPSGSLPKLTANDVCVALSYAKLTMIQSELINLRCMTIPDVSQLKEVSQKIYSYFLQKESSKLGLDDELCIFIAIVELTAVPWTYKASERNRAVIGGVSRMKIQRHLNAVINNYKEFLVLELDIAEDKLRKQIKLLLK